MAGPLDGVRVLDLTTMISGPLATMLLADQGAEVIKIENTKGGDLTRLVSTARNGLAASYLNNNRNKKSLVLDLKDPRGLEAFRALAKTADVLVQNFRPGVMERLGIGPEDLHALAPGLIYVSISGFGATGPYAKKPVYDPLVQAVSGLASVQGGSDTARPRLVRTIVPDKLSGYVCAQAVTAALVARYRSGEGQTITLNMLDAVLAFLWQSDMGGRTFVGDEIETEKAQSFIDLIYETQDGYISVAVNSDKEWRGLCAAFDKPEWLEDPRFRTAKLRHANIDARLEATQEVLRHDTSAHWLARLEAHDVGCAAVLTRAEVIDHPQVKANGTVIEYDHPIAGRLRQTRQAAVFSGTPNAAPAGAPLYGAHSIAILREAGIGEAEIRAMIEAGTLVAAESDADKRAPRKAAS
ncbi:MAG: CoA transferase [Pseudomonadota bacterium]